MSLGTLYLMATMFGSSAIRRQSSGLIRYPLSGVAPQRDADIHRFADRPIVFVENLVAICHEVQNRRMHDDIVGAHRLRMAGQGDHRLHVLVGAGHDRARGGISGRVDRDLEHALALFHRHREKLALLAGDEEAVDCEVFDPMADVRP